MVMSSWWNHRIKLIRIHFYFWNILALFIDRCTSEKNRLFYCASKFSSDQNLMESTIKKSSGNKCLVIKTQLMCVCDTESTKWNKGGRAIKRCSVVRVVILFKMLCEYTRLQCMIENIFFLFFHHSPFRQCCVRFTYQIRSVYGLSRGAHRAYATLFCTHRCWSIISTIRYFAHWTPCSRWTLHRILTF